MKIISRIFRPLPQVLYQEPAFGCNYRCFFCLHGGEHGVEPVQLTPAAFGRIKPISDQAAHIHLAGLGEPFLNGHIGEYLAYFQEGRPEKSSELLGRIQSIPHNRGIVSYNLDSLKRQKAS